MGNTTPNCKGCTHCTYGVCKLLAGADCSAIKKCILEYKEIKSIQEGTLDYFIINRDPKEYLSYLGWIEKEKYPKVGEKLVRLTSGFNDTRPGDFVTVVEDSDKWHIFVEDTKGVKSCIPKTTWYKDVFKLQDYADGLSKGSEFTPTDELFLATDKIIKNVINDDGFKEVILGKTAQAALKVLKVIGGGIIYRVDAVCLVNAGYKLYSTSNGDLIMADEVPSSYIIIGN